MKRLVLTIALMLAGALAALAARPVEHTVAASPDATVTIEIVTGSLDISGWDRAEVRVTGTLGDDVVELAVGGGADAPSFEVVLPEGRRRRGGEIYASLSVSVPRGAGVDVETVNAPINISGVSGRIEAASVSGPIDIQGDSPAIEAETVSGPILISGSSGSFGSVEAESVSGWIRLLGAGGKIEAVSVSGNLEIEAGAVDAVELESVSGSVRFHGQPTAGRLSAESHSGNIELVLPSDLSARFEIESFSGRIDNELGPPARRQGRYEPGLSLEFVTGEGQARISVETFSGNIALRKQ